MSARKRVLLVVHRFWPHPGGSERLFYNVARRLAGRGFEITVFTTDAWHPESYHSPRKQRLSAGLETHEGLTIRRFGIRNIPLQFKALRVLSWLPVEALKLLSGSPYVLVPGFLWEVFHNRPEVRHRHRRRAAVHAPHLPGRVARPAPSNPLGLRAAGAHGRPGRRAVARISDGPAGEAVEGRRTPSSPSPTLKAAPSRPAASTHRRFTA